MVGLQSKAFSALPPKDETQPGSVELSFAVEDVDATDKEWKEKGVEMIEPTRPALWSLFPRQRPRRSLSLGL